ncbi:uncharacterized protein LOC134945656 isoform X2 [Pseudophryne corroboree]|uniref:uncharacterized protein LOC134945656 isoform X2 n=1 Tax=Pseudophryne corroboree TaxID=495146 RepID=UPI003081B1C5
MERGESADVAIFSRSEENDYRWLLSILSEDFTVGTFLISNSNHLQFIQEVRNCRFAILYHTKNRGRVNITNVTDSLYDEEIKVLSRELGKNQVIVVIDDLEDSSDDTKRRILEQQPSLRDLTRDISLFTVQDKVDPEVLRLKVQIIIEWISYDTESVAISTGILQVATVLSPSLRVWWDTYLAPQWKHLMLSSLWAVMCWRILCCKPSTPILPIRFLRVSLSYTVTLVSAYNAYREPSCANVTLSVLWVTASSRHLFYRKQRRSSVTVWRIMAYGLALFTFWKAWHSRITTEVSGQIYRVILLSPAILASE